LAMRPLHRPARLPLPSDNIPHLHELFTYKLISVQIKHDFSE
jgi:hypothetical protein